MLESTLESKLDSGVEQTLGKRLMTIFASWTAHLVLENNVHVAFGEQLGNQPGNKIKK